MTPDQYCTGKAAPPGSSLYYSFLFLPAPKRRALTALHAFREEVLSVPVECEDPVLARMKLAWWRGEVRALSSGIPQHPVVQALAACAECRRLPVELWDDIVEGAEMDLVSNAYTDFDALHLYCDKTGAVVARMAAEICGYQDAQTLQFASDLGCGLALAELIRDFGKHARRGRIYLPRDEMAERGVSSADILRYRETDSFSRLMQFQAARAERYLDSAQENLPQVDRHSQLSGLVLAAIYRALLDALRADGFRVLSKRSSLTPIRKLWIAWKTRMRA